ncbi:LysR family transcriptional regulator [Bradyrhizobium sp. GCM10023182]|uniref:LysR family transcriptional regulator n=1 Tax=Bradyrhizobium zhengyangense TaxID=2911009 RepID=A0ABS9LHK6_9BRAD|nr:LysR family transcriptional regulator [Bradyrhizobium zhengyangense]MCG2666323.1 LysR family transcriptional regulator [Bradyrhizobium zhengyangense]
MTWQWDDIRFFLAVSRAGSLSAAARTLGVGHVTVGRRIALLEKQLGVTLLNRNPDGFVTTPAGEAILRQCAAMESAAADLERIVAGHDALLKGSVRVATTEALGYQLVAPAIATLRKSHPELRVDLITGVRTLDIARREADLAVRFARPSASDLICRKLGDVAFSLYASKRYLASKGAPKQGQGLAGFDLITYSGTPTAMGPFFMGESIEGAQVALRSDSPFIQLRAAANHTGIAEVTCFLGDRAPDVVRVWPDRPPARRALWMIMHQDMKRAARIKAVSNAITETYRREKRTLEQGLAAA